MTAEQYSSLIDTIEDRTKKEPQQEVFIFLSPDGSEQLINISKLQYDTKRVALSLINRGIKPGDLLFLVHEHGYELVANFLGTIYCGAIPAIFPYYYPEIPRKMYLQRLQKLFQLTKARGVLTQNNLLETFEIPLANHGIETIKLLDPPNDTIPQDDLRFSTASKREKIAYIQFSSGTSGLPRGVMISHEAILHYLKVSEKIFAQTEKDIIVGWLPLYHDMGLISQILQPLYTGSKSVIISPTHWIQHPEVLFTGINSYKGTMSWMPNFAFKYCVRKIQDKDLTRVDLSSWRVLVSGSEIVEYDAFQQFASRFSSYGFNPESFTVGYGMAEHVAGVSVTPHEREPDIDWVSDQGLQEMRAIPAPPHSDNARLIVSCGFPKTGVEIKIIDDHERTLGEREVGEVLVKSNMLFSGYYEQPEQTSKAFHHGWFRTGDLGYQKEGQLYICGRKKDLIIVGGRNIQPEIIEQIARREIGEKLRLAVAFGIRDEKLGTEVPVLVCELRTPLDLATSNLIKRNIRQQAKQQLNVSLGDVLFVKKGWIFKTTSSKIKRQANLRKYLDKHYQGEKTVFVNPLSPLKELEHQIIKLIESTLAFQPIRAQQNLLELGLDSLSAINLLTEIEVRTGIIIPTSDFFKRPTIEHLVTIIHQQAQEGLSDSRNESYEHLYLDERKPNLLRLKPRELIKFLSHYIRYLDFNNVRKSFLKSLGKVSAVLFPYKLGIKALSLICKQRWIKTLLFRNQVNHIQQFMELNDTKMGNNTTLYQSLMFNLGGIYTSYSLERLNPDEYRKWVTIEGEALLLNCLRLGRGVIVVRSHDGFGDFWWRRIFNRLCPDWFIIGGLRRTLIKLDAEPSFLSQSGSRSQAKMLGILSQLHYGRKVLSRGGIVVIMGDGQEGISPGINIPFYGRLRNFKTGFAELALLTGAQVVPAISTMQEDGKFTLSFTEPLNLGNLNANYNERVETILMQFLDSIETRWRTSPGSVRWDRMKKHLESPPISD